MSRSKTFTKPFIIRMSEADERRIAALKDAIAPEFGILSTAALMRFCVAQVATARSVPLV